VGAIPWREESLLEQFVEPAHSLFLIQVAVVLSRGDILREPTGKQRLPVRVKVAGQGIRTLPMKQRVFPRFLRFVEVVFGLFEAPVFQITPYPPVTQPGVPHYQDVESIGYSFLQILPKENLEISPQPGEKR
jgi:hypothetical protein